ncbi:hypothetical protein [Vibrio brasiliensis]|uniref:PE-PGRS family protein n=1 Tax=Vibrio brasiliensis LMG 20546 TaxID=945543 RepID=E8LW50_9VIBR|nr:hypothetical protein [Vibrio brasiliensis]EGA65104.1 hypothetical protein VIBR0546_09167 [Vibrio brasiliensis LMG 20546]
MDNLIKTEGHWQQGKPAIKHNGVWRFAKRVFHKVNAQWVLTYNRKLVIDISTNQVNYNLFSALSNIVPDVEEIEVNIHSSVVISSRSSAVSAFNVGNAFTGKNVVINNWGSIIGKGGKGGKGGIGNTRGGHGGAGGTALYVRTANPLILHNHGRILGGGGGGAGGSAFSSPGSAVSFEGAGGGGGGGAGGGEGSTGGRKDYAVAGRGGNGSLESYGSGGAPFILKGKQTLVWGVRGGRGGRHGEAGQSTARFSASWGNKGLVRPSGASGGRGGYAIDGQSKVMILFTGAFAGAQVN